MSAQEPAAPTPVEDRRKQFVVKIVQRRSMMVGVKAKNAEQAEEVAKEMVRQRGHQFEVIEAGACEKWEYEATEFPFGDKVSS